MNDDDTVVVTVYFYTTVLLLLLLLLLLLITILIENKLIICALANLHYKISRENFEPEPGSGGLSFESRFWFKFFS